MSQEVRLYTDGARINEATCLFEGKRSVYLERSGQRMLQIPRITKVSKGDDKQAERNQENMDLMENQKAVYRHLSNVPGIVETHEITPRGILVTRYMSAALNLWQRLHLYKDNPDSDFQEPWILEMLGTVAQCHRQRVIVGGIHLSNFLVTDDYELRMIIGSKAKLVPEGQDFDNIVTDNDASVYHDLLCLAGLIAAVANWDHDYTVLSDGAKDWPKSYVRNFAFAELINDCIDKRFANINQMEVRVRKMLG